MIDEKVMSFQGRASTEMIDGDGNHSVMKRNYPLLSPNQRDLEFLSILILPKSYQFMTCLNTPENEKNG